MATKPKEPTSLNVVMLCTLEAKHTNTSNLSDYFNVYGEV